MPYIYSTLSEPQKFTQWIRNGENLPQAGRSVLINGGHGKADQKTLITPIGVKTEVSQEDLEFLMTFDRFKAFIERKFITVLEKSHEPEVVVADMTPADESAPLTEADFDGGAVEPQKVTESEAVPAPRKAGRPKRAS